MAYGKSRLTNPQIVKLVALVPAVAEPKLNHAMNSIKCVANLAVKRWIRYHEDHGTLAKVEAKQPCAAMPPELTAEIRRLAAAQFPDLTYATINAVVKWLDQTISTQKSPKSATKRWKQVLRHEESHWSFTNPLPIRLWSGNSSAGMDERGPYLVLRVERKVEPGKVRATSEPVVIRFQQPTKGKDDLPYRQMYAGLCAVARGDVPMAQSQLWRDGRKWFFSLTVEGPERKPSDVTIRDKKLKLFIRPGRRQALRVHANTKVGGFGDDALDQLSRAAAAIAHRKKSLAREFGDSVPSHIREQMAAKWRGTSQAVARSLVSQFAKAIGREHFGTVIWLDGDNRSAALATCGKLSERDERELFPFEFMRRVAEKKCEEMGIEFIGRANFRSVKRRKNERRKRLTAGAV